MNIIKLLAIPLLLGISTLSYAVQLRQQPQQPLPPPLEQRQGPQPLPQRLQGQESQESQDKQPQESQDQQPQATAEQQVEQAINAAIAQAVTGGKDPVAAAAAATALAVKDAVANNPNNPAAAAAAATAAAMKAVTSNSSITKKGAAASAIVQSAISAAPKYSADIRTAAVNAAPESLRTEITQAANYAVFNNKIQLADANPTAHGNDIPSTTNIYAQLEANIESATENNEITAAQSLALQVQLRVAAPNNGSTKSHQALQQEIFAAHNAGLISTAESRAFQVAINSSLPPGSQLVLSPAQ